MCLCVSMICCWEKGRKQAWLLECYMGQEKGGEKDMKERSVRSDGVRGFGVE